MPEYPDVTVYIERLRAYTEGQTLETIRLASPFLLRTVTPPPRPAPGELRRARPDEAPRLCDWVASFTADTGMAMEDETRELREHRIGARIAAGDVYVWQHGDEVVSLNSVAGKTTSGIRINMVYTPPAQRGHGYASASVAALAQRMLDGDAEHGRNSFVCLYADADAPAVNRIYARVGFEHVYDSVQIRFAR